MRTQQQARSQSSWSEAGHFTGTNNFTLLRTILASLVVVGHYGILGERTEIRFAFSYAEFAVQAFFVVSGYLIVATFDRYPHPLPFLVKRIFRIYPLYFAVVVMQAIIMSYFLIDVSTNLTDDLFQYLVANLMLANFLKPDMGGLFTSVNGNGVNPSLWTIKIEIGFYLLLPLLHYLYQRWGWPFLVFVFMASSLYFEALRVTNYEFAKQLPGQLRFFVIGMACYYFRSKLSVSTTLAVVIGGSCIALSSLNQGFLMSLVYPFLIGIFVHLFANCIKLPQIKLDLSYGIYLLHAPLIQLALLTGLYRFDLWFFTGLATVIVVLAYLARKYIEAPGIALGKRIAKGAATT